VHVYFFFKLEINESTATGKRHKRQSSARLVKTAQNLASDKRCYTNCGFRDLCQFHEPFCTFGVLLLMQLGVYTTQSQILPLIHIYLTQKLLR